MSKRLLLRSDLLDWRVLRLDLLDWRVLRLDLLDWVLRLDLLDWVLRLVLLDWVLKLDLLGWRVLLGWRRLTTRRLTTLVSSWRGLNDLLLRWLVSLLGLDGLLWRGLGSLSLLGLSSLSSLPPPLLLCNQLLVSDLLMLLLHLVPGNKYK